MHASSLRNTVPTNHGRHHEIVKETDSLIQRRSHSSLGAEAQALIGKLRGAAEVMRTTAVQARKQVKSGLNATEHAVKRHPLRSVGIALGAGFAIGFLTQRFYRKST